jgi:YhcG PDDEXK nuclease domain
VIELKIGDFKPADTGQVELYLRWLDRHERQEGEEPPVAIILCAGKKQETVEYLKGDPAWVGRRLLREGRKFPPGRERALARRSH